MALETISHEEFDKRLDAANKRRTQELQAIEEEQMRAAQLLSYYEEALTELEAALDSKATTSLPTARPATCIPR